MRKPNTKTATKRNISWKFTIGSIILLLLIIIVVPLITSSGKNVYKDECRTDGDCNEEQVCKYSPDFDRKICVEKGTIDCSVTNPVKCDMKQANSCSRCLTSIPLSCIAVSYGYLKIVSAGKQYIDGTYNVLGGSGKNMQVEIETDKGNIISAKVFAPGKGYKKNDVMTVEADAKGGKLQLLTEPRPYFFKQGDDITVLPESEDGKGWCLPDIVDNTCNPFTSDQILVNIDPVHNKYEWGCYCTNPDMFGQDEIFKDCNVEHACGYPNDGKLYVLSNDPKTCSNDSQCGHEEKCCAPDEGSGRCSDAVASSSIKKHCYAPWTANQSRDPRDGRCECSTGLEYLGQENGSDYTKKCVTDSCVPGRIDGKKCDCPSGYLACPDSAVRGSKLYNMCKDRPQCIHDPCAPGGTWSLSDHKCICDNEKGYASVLDDTSSVGSRCVKKCVNNGPCWQRGTCKVANDKEICDGCACPYQNKDDPTHQCRNIDDKKGRKDDQCYHDDECCSGKCKQGFFPDPNKYCE